MSQASAETKVVGGVVLRRDPAREPCFTVVQTDAEMQEWPDMSEISRRERLHRHMNNETGAMEIAARCLVDFPEASWDLRMSLARQVADEARHATLLLRRLRELEGFKGEFPVANFEWGVTLMLGDLPGRLAVQNRTFEAGLIDILGTLRNRWREAGDHATADMLETILADEITHVRFANRWIKRMTEQDPRILLKVALAVRFLGRVNAQLAPKPGEVNAVGIAWTEERRLPPAVNVEDRKEAEFSDEEIAEVLRQAGFRSILPSMKGA
jgi:bacterioferritin (cytochrome b1)